MNEGSTEALLASPFFRAMRLPMELPGRESGSGAVTIPAAGAPLLPPSFFLFLSVSSSDEARDERVWRWASAASTSTVDGSDALLPLSDSLLSAPSPPVSLLLRSLPSVPVGLLFVSLSSSVSSMMFSHIFSLFWFLLCSSIVLLMYDLKVESLLKPLERMIQFIQRMIGNPLGEIRLIQTAAAAAKGAAGAGTGGRGGGRGMGGGNGPRESRSSGGGGGGGNGNGEDGRLRAYSDDATARADAEEALEALNADKRSLQKLQLDWASRTLAAGDIASDAKRLRAGTVAAATAPTSPVGVDEDGRLLMPFMLLSSVPTQSPLGSPIDKSGPDTSPQVRLHRASSDERKSSGDEEPAAAGGARRGASSASKSPRGSGIVVGVGGMTARWSPLHQGMTGGGGGRPGSKGNSPNMSPELGSFNGRRRRASQPPLQPQHEVKGSPTASMRRLSDTAGAGGRKKSSSKRNSASHSPPASGRSPSLKAKTPSPALAGRKLATPPTTLRRALRPSAAAAASATPGGALRRFANETSTVELSMQKLAKLIQVGFGEAGAAIISRNLAGGLGGLSSAVTAARGSSMSQSAAASSLGPGGIDPFGGQRGSKMFAIFGFCDLRNIVDAYFETNEEEEIGAVKALGAGGRAKGAKSMAGHTLSSGGANGAGSNGNGQSCGSGGGRFIEHIMLFINELQSIVHGETHRYAGFVNSSIGSNTLMAWKFDVAAFERVERAYGDAWSWPTAAAAQPHAAAQQQHLQYHQQQQHSLQHFSTAPTGQHPSTLHSSAVGSSATPLLGSQPAPGGGGPAGLSTSHGRMHALSIVTGAHNALPPGASANFLDHSATATPTLGPHPWPAPMSMRGSAAGAQQAAGVHHMPF